MISCDRITPLLSLYLEREASPAESIAIRGHLEACGECRKEFVDLKATVSLVRSLPVVAAPDDFEARVLMRVRAAEFDRTTSSAGDTSRVGDTSRAGEGLASDRPLDSAPDLDWGQDTIWDRAPWWEGWLPRFAAAAAAAALVAVSMVGTHEIARRNGLASSPELATSTRSLGTPATGSVVVARPGGVIDLKSGDSKSGDSKSGASPDGGTLASNTQARNPQYDDLRALFPDIPPEVIEAMPLNGQTYASDRMVAQRWQSPDGPQMLAPVDFHGGDKVYIYR